MWRTRVALYGLATLAAIATAGCGDDSSGPGGGDVGEGEFTAEITGALDEELSGQAFYFQVQEGQGEDGLVISLAAGGPGIALTRGNPALPAVGTYGIVDGAAQIPQEDFMAASFWGTVGDFTQCFSGDGGELTITESGANLAGEFTIEGACLDLDTGALVPATITGEFNAVEGEDEGN